MYPRNAHYDTFSEYLRKCHSGLHTLKRCVTKNGIANNYTAYPNQLFNLDTRATPWGTFLTEGAPRVVLFCRVRSDYISKGERPDRCWWQRKGGERVAAVGGGRRRFNAKDNHREPQQGKIQQRQRRCSPQRNPLQHYSNALDIGMLFVKKEPLRRVVLFIW